RWRQGRPIALAGQAPDRARLGDEPRRPPARRRRGQVEGWAPSRHTLGRADARQAHAPQAQGIRQVDRPSTQTRQGKTMKMLRIFIVEEFDPSLRSGEVKGKA